MKQNLSFFCQSMVWGLLLSLPSWAMADIAPENVAVVVNGDSEVSRTIAEEYLLLRGIPQGNLISVTDLPDKEKLTVEDFRQLILIPVLTTLQQRQLLPQIDVIAYSAEIPTAIDVRSDLAGRKLPKIYTPTASVNGLTFLYQSVLRKDIRYLELNTNLYARRVAQDAADGNWTPAHKQQYMQAVIKWQQHAQALQQRPADTPPSQEQQEQTTTLLQELVRVCDEILQAHPGSSHLHYNRACGLALLGETESAVSALTAAVAQGWWDAQRTSQDEDLQSLRKRADFQALLKQMQQAEFSIQPAVGFRSAVGWLPDGNSTQDPRAPRYLLSTVLACTTGRGTSQDEALANLRRTAQADGTRPTGAIYFMKNKDVRSTTREWAFQNAARQLQELGVKAVIEEGVLPQNKTDIAGAVIGTANFDWSKSNSSILPGAIVEHLTSFGGAMASGAGQTPLTEFLKLGAAGASGTVTEPYAIQAKFPHAFLHVHYASGCTLAEAFYQSVTGPYQLLIVGDPLAQPWKRRFSISEPGLSENKSVSGEVTLEPQTESPDEILPDHWELYVDGLRVAASKANAPLRWNTQQHPNGEHSLTIIARGNDRVQTVARIVTTVTVHNPAD